MRLLQFPASIPTALSSWLFGCLLCYLVYADGGETCDWDCSSASPDSSLLPWWKDPEMKLWNISDILNCTAYWNDDPPVRDSPAWAYARGAYIAIVGPDQAEFPPDVFGSGFAADTVEVRVSEEKGRGLFATAPFRAGERVWEDHFTACFDDGMEYRRFLASLPADLACDVLDWAYSGTEYGVCVDLDEGSLINHAASTEENRVHWQTDHETPNIMVDPETGLHVATVDIQPGEELLIDYRLFGEKDSYDLLGLGTWENSGLDDG